MARSKVKPNLSITDDMHKLYEEFVKEWEEMNGKINDPQIIPYEYQELLKEVKEDERT